MPMCQLTNMSMHRLINVPIAQCSDCPICRLAVYTHRSIYILIIQFIKSQPGYREKQHPTASKPPIQAPHCFDFI